MLHLTKKLYSSPNRETVYIYTYYSSQPIPLFTSDLAPMHCDVRWDVGAQVMSVVDYAYFALNKSERLSITF